MSSSSLPDVGSTVRAERTQLRIPSRPEWVEAAGEYLRRHAVCCGLCSEARSQRLALVLREALLNAVVHGNLEAGAAWPPAPNRPLAEVLAPFVADAEKADREVDILVDYDGRRCQWVFTDEGRGFDVAAILRRQEGSQTPPAPSPGRGIWIMRAFMDEVQYGGGGRQLRLTLKKAAQPEPQHQLRVPFDSPVEVFPLLPDGAPDYRAGYKAVCCDLSEVGIVLLQRQPPPAPRLIVGLQCNERVLYLPAVVTHTQTLTPDLVEAALRFETRLGPGTTATAQDTVQGEAEAPQDALVRMVYRFQRPSQPAHERRAYPRVTFSERVQILGEPDNQFAFARDLSRGGIALIATFPLPVGQLRVLQLPRADGPGLLATIEVVRCKAIAEGFFEVGGKFVEGGPGG